jgi:hypothetical protein
MENKKNQLLIGVILVVIGIYTLLNRWISLPFWNLEQMWLLIAGGALLFLYHTKQKVWALIVGSIFVFCGALRLVSPIFMHNISLTAPMIFMIPGFVFIILYFANGVIGFLIPGSILIWFGIFIGLVTNGWVNGILVPISLFGNMGMAFMTMYILGRTRIGKWPLIPGMILLGFSLFLFTGFSAGTIFRIASSLVPIILIGLGIWIVFKNGQSR